MPAGCAETASSPQRQSIARRSAVGSQVSGKIGNLRKTFFINQLMERRVWCLPPARHEKLANLDARQRKITQNCQLCLLGSPKIGASRWRAWTSSCQNLRPAERGSLWTASTANQSPRVQSLPMPCGKGPLSAGLSRLSWVGEPGREKRVRHFPHHFSGGGFRGQCCPAVPAGRGGFKGSRKLAL